MAILIQTTTVCVYTYMQPVTISKKRGHEFEGEWGGAYARVWRKERD